MANRHKGFYMDIRAGEHDDDHGWEPPTPEATALPLGSLNTLTGSSYTDCMADPGEELRVDEGEPFRYCDFVDFYGEKDGKARWERAGRWVQAPRPEPAPLAPLPDSPRSPKGASRGGSKKADSKNNKLSPEAMKALMAKQQEARASPKPPGGGTGRAAALQDALPEPREVCSIGGSSDRQPVPSRQSSVRSKGTGGSSGKNALPGRRASAALPLSPRSPKAGIKAFGSGGSECSRSPAGSPAHSPVPLRSSDARQRGRVDGEMITATPALPAQSKTAVLDNGKARINVVVVGHVDAGKSTIMGHLLVQLGLVSQKTLHKYEKDAKAKGKQSFHFAWVLDETEEERDRGVTMDVAVTYFETGAKRVTLLDCPGHREFVTNMITGATQADAAVLVVNASAGEFETGFGQGGQTKEHLVLLRSVGVTQLIVAVNKMDVVGYDQGRFEEIEDQLSEFLLRTGFKKKDVRFVPVAGLSGANLTEAAAPGVMEWWAGGTLIHHVDTLPNPERVVEYPLRMAVSDVMKSLTLGQAAVGGKVHTGRVKAGDKVLLMPQMEPATVKGIERLASSVDEAVAGDNVEMGLAGIDPNTLGIGQVVCLADDPLVKVSQKFQATLVNFSDRMLTKSFQGVVHFQSNTVSASVTRLLSAADGKNPPKLKPKCLHKNQTGTVEITTSRPICVELADEFRDLGRFMLRAGGETVAAGVVKAIYPLVRA